MQCLLSARSAIGSVLLTTLLLLLLSFSPLTAESPKGGNLDRLASVGLSEPVRVFWELRPRVRPPFAQGALLAEAERSLDRLLNFDRTVRLEQSSFDDAFDGSTPHLHITIEEWRELPGGFVLFRAQVFWVTGDDEETALGTLYAQSPRPLDSNQPSRNQLPVFSDAARQALRPLSIAILNTLPDQEE